MTVLANVSCKVRVNGGSPTTYTNASTPAIAQNADCAFGYELKLAASSFNDGDVVERTWLYSGSAAAFGAEVIGPATVDGAHYTNARGDNLANLDAPVSGIAAAVWAVTTRTLTAISDSTGITTLLNRLTGQRATNLDNLDAPVSSASGSSPSAIASAVWSAASRTLSRSPRAEG
jgi:hypothetical protein